MRVISGSARGRKLIALSGLDTRPTTDRVKESVFNIISPYLPAGRVLDLFSGSGALGIEALSRGSERCVFVEKGKAALDVTKRNIELARVGERAETVLSDAISYLRRTREKFDIIFLDPPYNTGLLTEAVGVIADCGLLSEDGIIVAESEFCGEEPRHDSFDVVRRAKYGNTEVFVLRTRMVQGE